jgi:hypothetical protein
MIRQKKELDDPQNRSHAQKLDEEGNERRSASVVVVVVVVVDERNILRRIERDVNDVRRGS